MAAWDIWLLCALATLTGSAPAIAIFVFRRVADRAALQGKYKSRSIEVSWDEFHEAVLRDRKTPVAEVCRDLGEERTLFHRDKAADRWIKYTIPVVA